MSHFKRLTGSLTLLLLGVYLSQMLAVAQTLPSKTYLPAIFVSYAPTVFAVETTIPGIIDSQVTAQAKILGADWLRLNGVLWSAVEPERGTYNWAVLSQLDSALEHAKTAGLTPTVIIRGTPLWASAGVDNLGRPSGCAAIQDVYVPDYARFLAALAQRYKGQVTYWELGNEPDVDSRLLNTDDPFGCWGNINDPFYGGERYGRMLRAVVPAMRAVNPYVQIIVGGLLLDSPQSSNPGLGRPELFLEGVLKSGAADSFDILAYHAYPSYLGVSYDHDLLAGGKWNSLGGWTLGKASYLRGIMTRYGVSKPLWLNESGLLCSPNDPTCGSPPAAFFDAQADHLVRIMSRAAAGGIQQVSWYTLDGPGWRSAGLLDENQLPRPSFIAYQEMIKAVGKYTAVKSVNYGANIEAYRFSRRDGAVADVLWSRNGVSTPVSVPTVAFQSAIVRDKTNPVLSQDAANVSIAVGFRAVFIVRMP